MMFDWLKKLFKKEKEVCNSPLSKYKFGKENSIDFELDFNRKFTDLVIPMPEVKSPLNPMIYYDTKILYRYKIEVEITVSTNDDCDYKKEKFIFYNSEKIDQDKFKNIVSKYYENGKFDKDKFLEENINFIELPEFDDEEIKVTISNVIII